MARWKRRPFRYVLPFNDAEETDFEDEEGLLDDDPPVRQVEVGSGPSSPIPLSAHHRLSLAGRRDLARDKIANALFHDGCVQLEAQNPCEATYRVLDAERDDVDYQVRLWTDAPLLRLSCTCPDAGAEPNLICEHEYAAYLHLSSKYRPPWAPPLITWEDTLKQILPSSPPKPVQPNQALVFTVVDGYYGWTVLPVGVPLSNLGDVDVNNVDALCDAILKRKLSTAAKEVTQKIEHGRYANADDAACWLAQATQGSTDYSARGLKLPYDRLFQTLKGRPLFRGTKYDPLQRRVQVDDEPGQPIVTVTRDKRVLLVTAAVSHHGRRYRSGDGSDACIICEKPVWTMAGDRIFPVSEASASFAQAFKSTVRVPMNEQDRFFAEYLPQFMNRCHVESEMVVWEEVDTPPTPRIYLIENSGELVVELRFDYSGIELLPAKNAKPMVSKLKGATSEKRVFSRIQRRLDVEIELYQALSKQSLKRGASYEQFAVKSSADPVDFLIHQVPRLVEAGFEIYGEENLKLVRVNRTPPRLDFTITSGIDWLDLTATVSFGDTTVPLREVGRAIRKKERYVKLADGSMGTIPPEWVARYRHLFAFAEETAGGLRVSASHIAIVEDAIALADQVNMDAEFQRRRERLKAFSSIEPRPVPSGLNAVLRPYQKAGVDWLHFLHEYEFGGCLADDMGIGKTIQTLAFLLSLKEIGASTSANLVVVPRSLLFNWQREAARFAPSLRVLVHDAGKRTRKAMHFEEYDLVITTYGIMLRDVDMLKEYRFHYTVLDESQAIKNPVSATGRAARTLASDHRLVLTGTPVENSTVELWSQFAFVCPGLLGGLDYFRQEFAGAIEKNADEASAQLLRKMVFPFILRRTKDQVASELPPRTERIVYAEMDDDQRAFYEQTRDRFRGELLNLISSEGMNSARMRILEALLRLRQIANHPHLMDPESTAASGKLELLMETLRTLRSEGHKALVFSQFVKMLTIVRGELDAEGIPYLYLDGKTQNRQALVDAYQADPSIPFFLISLRAGGVGLNLTAADYVIHIDPWWNPAVERQASDRTHRIGQDKPVFVYKLITRDTVEEKILELQERKRALVDQLVATDEGFFKSLTPGDIEVLLQ